LRTRQVVLTAEGAEFFAQQTRDKLPGALLFSPDGEREWRRHLWAKATRDAIASHNEKARGKERLPLGLGAYVFRHARISELLRVHAVDPLTVAQQTGTSLAMIERAYYRFVPAALAEKLATLKASP